MATNNFESIFQVGNIVCWGNFTEHAHWQILSINGKSGRLLCVKSSIDNTWSIGQKYDTVDLYGNMHTVILIKPKSNNMASTLIEKFKLARKGEPEKSFILKGILNMDETFTKDGEELFKYYLLSKFGQDFKKEVVDTIPAPEDKK
jgi:hypothetical protein